MFDKIFNMTFFIGKQKRNNYKHFTYYIYTFVVSDMNNLYIKYNYKYFLMQITVIVECNNNFSKLNIVIKEDNTYWQLEFIITNCGGGGGAW